MNKVKANYWTDVIIALAFVVSAVSGIVFLLPMTTSAVFGVSYQAWSQIHTWGSLAMLSGVLAHLVLHWKWIAAMTKKTFLQPARSGQTSVGQGGFYSSRRSFLRYVGVTAGSIVAIGAGYRWFLGSLQSTGAQAVTFTDGWQTTQVNVPSLDTSVDSLTDIQPNILLEPESAEAATAAGSVTIEEPILPTVTCTPQPAGTSTPTPGILTQNASVSRVNATASVRCPKRISYDPYPGKCRHYVDRDGDGYCDLSLPA